MPEDLSCIGEFGLIDLIKKTAYTAGGVIKGIGDDTAVIRYGFGPWLLFTTDMLLEGVHFSKETAPRSIGHKALACSMSDIAAMGGRPGFALISLGVPADTQLDFVKEIYKGINKLARQFRVSIAGGDTVRSPQIIINVALLGEVQKGRVITRAGAKKGDRIFVTGPLGRSLKTGRHLSFVPRIKEAQDIVKRCRPSSMIDISDGLAADLGHILEESRAGAVLYEERIPKSPDATLKEALYDGEDFELLFTVDTRQAERLKRMKQHFYPIGEIVDSRQGLQMVDPKGRKSRIALKGFRHF